VISKSKSFSRRTGSLLLVGTVLGGSAAPLLAQNAPAPQPAPTAPATAQPQATPTPPPPPAERIIRSIAVRGNQRLEPETIRAYANLSPGQTYTAQTLDQALKDLYATQLFADVTINGGDTGNLVIAVRENPVINRIILEGNKRLKDDKITPEIKLAPRQIFTRSAVRSDVDRILELYRRQGRFAARVDPKIVQLDQNRVDVVFEIYEGDLAKVRAINILGNTHYDDARLRKEMYTRQAGGVLGFMKSNDTYDPDRLAADQQKLRAFYLTQGYADFRVVQALAELTPDRRDFVITYVVEEGPRYHFGTVEADSALRDFPNADHVLERKSFTDELDRFIIAKNNRRCPVLAASRVLIEHSRRQNRIVFNGPERPGEERPLLFGRATPGGARCIRRVQGCQNKVSCLGGGDRK